MKLLGRFLLSLVLSAVFLYVAFRDVDLRAMWEHVVAVKAAHVAFFLVTLTAIQLLRIFRWGLLVAPFATLSMGAVFRIASVGMLLVLVLPLRLGELARPYLLKRESQAPLSSGLGAVTVERTADGLMVCFLFFLATLSLDESYPVPVALRTGALMALCVFSSAALLIALAWASLDRVRRVLEAVGRPFSAALTAKVVATVEAFVVGLRAFPNRRAVLLFFASTLLVWLAHGVGFFVVMRGFGWDLPFGASFVLVSVIVIGIMIPAGPGFLGTYQGAVLAGLSVFGIGATEAAAFGAVVYPMTVVVVVGFALPHLFESKGRLLGLVRDSVEAPEAS